MDLVVGATGILGGEICKGLLNAGRQVRVLVRETSDKGKVDALKAQGAEIVNGDLKDEASLKTACAGVSNVISTASSTLSRAEGDDIETVDRQGQIALVEAAKDAGVSHFVYVSFPPDENSFPLQDAKRAVEDAIKSSGVDYTILHPTHFREVWLSPALGFDVGEGKARIFGDGDGKISWISMFDVKDAVVASLDNPKARNKVLRLGGPEALSQHEVVARFETRIGRTLDKEVVPLGDLKGMHAGEDPLERSFAALMLICAEQGCQIDNTEAEEILGHKPSGIDDFVAHCVDAAEGA